MEHDRPLLGALMEKNRVTVPVDPWPPTHVWEDRAAARADFIDQYLPKHGVGAELGVYCGHLTRVLLDITQPKTLHLIDPWFTQFPDWEQFGVIGPTGTEAFDMVKSRYAGELATGQVVLHVGSDLDILPQFGEHTLDWAYIDTIHKYNQAAAELELLKTVVKPDGVIAGDDWITDPEHPSFGVSQAVTQFCEREGYHLIYASDADAQFAIKRT